MKRILLLLTLTVSSLTLLCAESGWRASWISTDLSQSTVNTWLAFRKVVSFDNLPKTLTAKIAADSKYWLWINDELVVFEGGLKRGPKPGATYYDSVDIAPYLRAGDNVIAVLVWHFGKNGFSHVNSGTAALLFEAAGDGVEILSDRSWQCAVHSAYQCTDAPQPNFRLPESNVRYDARRELTGWKGLNSGKGFQDCLIVAPAGAPSFGELIERPIPLWRDYGLKSYADVSRSGDTVRCKLPYNCHATPYLKVKAPAGEVIRMQTDNYRVRGIPTVRAEYVTRDGEQEYESYGWMNGHEMIYLVPQAVELIDVKYRETGYDTEFAGSFFCNDPFLNEVWQRAQRTLYVTMRDTYMDCPDRERAQWFGDETIELGEAFYALSPSSQKLAVKGIHEVVNWQRADGTIYGPCPTGNYFRELPVQMLAFVGWYGFYTQYYYSGDSSFAGDVYDRVHRYLHEVWQLDGDGFPVVRHGEWSWGDWGADIDLGILTTCWYYLALKAEREFASMLGKDGDAQEDEALMKTIADRFDGRYWNGEAFRSQDYQGATDDRSQAMAVVSGLASEDKYPSLLSVLKKEYHASPYMEKYVLEAIFQMGDAEFALQRLRSRYDNMISNYPGCTTLFEGWDVSGGSINHAWTGGVLTLLSQRVCGIVPTSPGFASFRVRPVMGGLTDASATVDTRYGKIEVALKRKGGKIRMTVNVPEGTVAEVPVSPAETKTLAPGRHSLTVAVRR